MELTATKQILQLKLMLKSQVQWLRNLNLHRDPDAIWKIAHIDLLKWRYVEIVSMYGGIGFTCKFDIDTATVYAVSNVT